MLGGTTNQKLSRSRQGGWHDTARLVSWPRVHWPPVIPGTIVETRGLCHRKWFQLQAAAPLSEYDVIVIWPKSYSHSMFGEPTQYSGSANELMDLKKAGIADFGNAFWWNDRESELRSALEKGTRVIWIAVPDRPARFFGDRSLYDGYASHAAMRVMNACTLANRPTVGLSIGLTGATLSPYFEALRRAGSSLCWIPGGVANVQQSTLAATAEGYALGSQITVDGAVAWLLPPPPSSEALAALVQCALNLRPSQVRSARYHGIFLSHNSEDKPFVRRLKAALCAHGVEDVWVDEAELLVNCSARSERALTGPNTSVSSCPRGRCGHLGCSWSWSRR